MKINEEVVKKYIEYDNKEGELLREIHEIKQDKYKDMLNDYDIKTVKIFFKIRKRLGGFSQEFVLSLLMGTMFIVPVIIALMFTNDIHSLNLDFLCLIGICGIMILSNTVFISIRDFKLTRLYKKLTK